MANPPIFQPGFNYSNWQATNPVKPLPAQQVDNDFANAARSINQAISAIGDVRRSDGKLKNGIVGPDALAPQFSLGFSFEGTWANGVEYQAGDGVVFAQTFYAARASHTSSVSNQPPDDDTWTLLFSLDDIVVAGALSMPVATFLTDGVTTGFDLGFFPVSSRNVFVTIGGQIQDPSEYTINGSMLTFVNAPPTGPLGEAYSIVARAFATTGTLVIPEDGSVTPAKLASATTALFATAAQGAKANSAMQPAIYDPRGKVGDAFDPANHSGAFWTSSVTRTMKDRAKDICWAGEFNIDFTGANDSTTEIQKWLTQSAGAGWAQAPKGIMTAGAPLFVPKDIRLEGVAPDEQWNSGAGSGLGSNIGTIFNFVGSGVGARWTDIDGTTDKTNFKPALVIAGAGVTLQNFTVRKIDGAGLATTDADLWDAGIYVPGMQRVKLQRVNTIGKWQAGLYLDATWGTANTTLNALHPEIGPAGGMIEFNAQDCWFRGRWGVKGQGSTRAVGGYTSSTWLWSPPGTSDWRFTANRIEGGDRWYIDEALSMVDGGCFKHDAAAINPADVGQGHIFIGNAFRSAAKYNILLDRSNNDVFSFNYGEGNGSFGVRPFAITSRTRFTKVEGDQWALSFWVDDVEIRSAFSGLTYDDMRKYEITVGARQTGRMIHPNLMLPGVNGTTPVEVISREGSGLIDFYKDATPTTGARSLIYRMTDAGFRAATLLQALGSSAFPWLIAYIKELVIGNAGIVSGSGSPENVVSKTPGWIYLNTAGGGQKPLWVKNGGAGATGWRSVTISATDGT